MKKKNNKSTDPFSDSFVPYVTYHKSFFAYNIIRKKKEKIPAHFYLTEKYSGRGLDLNNKKDRKILSYWKRHNRVFGIRKKKRK